MKNIFRKFRIIGAQLVTMSFPPEDPYGTSSDENWIFSTELHYNALKIMESEVPEVLKLFGN